MSLLCLDKAYEVMKRNERERRKGGQFVMLCLLIDSMDMDNNTQQYFIAFHAPINSFCWMCSSQSSNAFTLSAKSN